MRTTNKMRTTLLISLVVFMLLTTKPSFATSIAGVSSIDSFIKNVINVISGIAGLVATGFFVVGGFIYITSSGNPMKLEKAKRTLLFSSIGLAITIAAFVLSNIVTQLATSAFGK